ncbi:hypothetical protein Sta7437_4177 [Stanieria cyanosphaera PCC 7437]|uniref:Uncharacterized protein n=1 Tax=Stanieria cyanosphaera (strain ATCC 29371 / PCC 7437) TaxID=111780 RepID=K9Y043_STAC7|nr:hypothetical protein [Stanieria cyanosphaera]AFZ37654.1 hypothetical protein Sta7437_4177 [Stanieria cyanosphaera PCC 7437]
MTVENVETNGNQVQTVESDHHTDEQQAKTLSLSVHKNTLLPGNRPVEPSHLQVVSTYSSVGAARPIVKSGMKISNSLTVSGTRPIAVSTLKVSETYSVMGNRPVASNEIDDPSTLMGYID